MAGHPVASFSQLCALLKRIVAFDSLPATGTELYVQDTAVKGDAAAHRRDSSEEARASWRPRLSSSSSASRRPTSEDCQPPCEMRSGCAALLHYTLGGASALPRLSSSSSASRSRLIS